MHHDLAIIGGGRWGRVILSVLATSDLPLDRITMVTKHNTALVHELASRLVLKHPLRIASELSDTPSAAIVVNAARSHFQTACELIERGVPLLIEKPVVLTPQEAQHIVALAHDANTIVVPGLSYRFCSYLHHFAERIMSLHPFSGFDLRWSDRAGEIRYGEQKINDESINVADDVMPHMWTILSVLFPGARFQVTSCQSTRGRKTATFTLCAERMKGTVTIERDSDRRCRIIQLLPPASLDFSEEPGMMTIGTDTTTADSGWTTGPKPLARQLRYFLECVERGKATDADEIALTESVRLTESASALLNAFAFVES